MRRCFLLLIVLACPPAAWAGDGERLPGTEPLTETGDLSARMLAGIERFLLRETARAAENRPALWQRELSSAEAFERSVAAQRERFRHLIGAVDPRLPVGALEYVATTRTPAAVARTDRYTVYAVRWPVLQGVQGEGLLLQPHGKPVAN